jgi:hypothetical protein
VLTPSIAEDKCRKTDGSEELDRRMEVAGCNAIACVLVSCFRFPRALCQGTTAILCAAGPDRYIAAE